MSNHFITMGELRDKLTDSDRLRILDCTSYFRWTDPASIEKSSGIEAYHTAHIPGAIYVDLVDELSGSSEAAIYPLLPPSAIWRLLSSKGVRADDHMVLYAQNDITFAARACWVLKRAGYKHVQVLNGTLRSWQEAGYDVSSDATVYEPVDHEELEVMEGLEARHEDITSEDPAEIRLISSSDSDFFSGMAPHHFGRKGHIPGSMSLPYKEWVGEDGTLDLPGIQKQLAIMGVTSSRRVITYCDNGVSACLLSLVLFDMDVPASVYNGSMYEWSRLDMPLEQGEARCLEVVVVGGGISGLSAALTLGRSRRHTMLFDAGTQRNQPSAGVHGVLALDGTPPATLLTEGRRQLAAYPTVRIHDRQVDAVERYGPIFVTQVADDRYYAKKVILATGVVDHLPEVEGLRALWGKKLFHCPYCFGYEASDRALGLIVAKDTPVLFHSMLIHHWSKKLIVFTNGAELFSDEEQEVLRLAGVELIEQSMQRVLDRDDHVVVVLDDGREVIRDALFTHTDLGQQTDLAERLGCRLDEKGFVSVNTMQETSVPGVMAVGDTTTMLSTVSIAMGSGQLGAVAANMALVREDMERLSASAKESPRARAASSSHGLFAQRTTSEAAVAEGSRAASSDAPTP